MVIADFEAASDRWIACSSALRADGRPRFYGTEPGPSHGQSPEAEGEADQACSARSKIHPGHDCARSRPHGTALLLAMVKEAKRVTALAGLLSSKA